VGAETSAAAGDDVGPIEVSALVLAVPGGFAEPVVDGLDARPVEHRDLARAPVTAGEPREERPVADAAEDEVRHGL
jgi:hypothetical protein